MLNEIVKKFLASPLSDEKYSSVVDKKDVINDLSNQDLYTNTGAFFDSEFNGIYGARKNIDKLDKQKDKIMMYRNLAKTPDVNDALEEIINEVIFSFSGEDILQVEINEENQKIQEAITEKFTKITKLMNLDKNIYNIVKTAYVDGQIVLHHSYDKNSVTNGIKAIKMIEPTYFYYDNKKGVYKYLNKKESNFFETAGIEKNTEYSPEEISREDFGLYEDGLTLSYLEYAVKPANQLRTLEDLLIPLRFSRSISRRVFNVDIGDLQNRKGEEAMREIQNKFRYKKFYNVQTGEITNQQHITSMVEDYWFANRSGAKGTTVDTLDETGNLGELDDILYFNKKLYKSMYIPSNRVSIDPNADTSWDYNDSKVTKEDVKFFMFISRVRKVFTSLFKEILKKEVISTGVMSEKEWNDYKDKISIKFTHENTFIEKMNLEVLKERNATFEEFKDNIGVAYSAGEVLRQVLKYSDGDVKDIYKEIESERKDKAFTSFYKHEEEI